MKIRSISIGATLVVLLCLFVFSCGRGSRELEITPEQQGIIEQTQQDLQGAQTQTAENELYSCPMGEHWDVRSDNPGECPKCGMNLVSLSQTEHKGNPPSSAQATD